MSDKALFSPVKIGNYFLKHRVVLAPMCRYRSNLDATISDLNVEYYSQRATEGGLLITEPAFISNLAGGYKQSPGIYNKEQIEAWKRVSTVVHAKKGIAFMQLWHIGRAGTTQLNPNEEQPVAPSSIAAERLNILTGDPYQLPRALELDEIKNIVQDYAQAAAHAFEAGFDGVEIHGANGFLIDQFINTSSNKRTDEYGGSIPNRARFALEVLDAVVNAIGPQRTAIRFAPGNGFQGMHDDTFVETWSYLTKEIQKNHPDLAYLHMTEPRADLGHESQVNKIDSLGPFRQLWKGTFISASGYSNATENAFEMAEKTGDLIAFGRAFIANPDLVSRLLNHQPLNKYDRTTFYSNSAKGYIDYPFYDNTNKSY